MPEEQPSKLPPRIISFGALPFKLEAPGSVLLTWFTIGAEEVQLVIDGQRESVNIAGTQWLDLSKTITVQLLASTSEKSATQSITIDVKPVLLKAVAKNSPPEVPEEIKDKLTPYGEGWLVEDGTEHYQGDVDPSVEKGFCPGCNTKAESWSPPREMDQIRSLYVKRMG